MSCCASCRRVGAEFRSTELRAPICSPACRDAARADFVAVHEHAPVAQFMRDVPALATLSSGGLHRAAHELRRPDGRYVMRRDLAAAIGAILSAPAPQHIGPLTPTVSSSSSDASRKRTAEDPAAGPASHARSDAPATLRDAPLETLIERLAVPRNLREFFSTEGRRLFATMREIANRGSRAEELLGLDDAQLEMVALTMYDYEHEVHRRESAEKITALNTKLAVERELRGPAAGSEVGGLEHQIADVQRSVSTNALGRLVSHTSSVCMSWHRAPPLPGTPVDDAFMTAVRFVKACSAAIAIAIAEQDAVPITERVERAKLWDVSIVVGIINAIASAVPLARPSEWLCYTAPALFATTILTRGPAGRYSAITPRSTIRDPPLVARVAFYAMGVLGNGATGTNLEALTETGPGVDEPQLLLAPVVEIVGLPRLITIVRIVSASFVGMHIALDEMVAKAVAGGPAGELAKARALRIGAVRYFYETMFTNTAAYLPPLPVETKAEAETLLGQYKSEAEFNEAFPWLRVDTKAPLLLRAIWPRAAAARPDELPRVPALVSRAEEQQFTEDYDDDFQQYADDDDYPDDDD